MTKKELSKKLEEALKDCAQLREENMRLRDLLVLIENRETLQQTVNSQKLPVFTDGIKVNSDSPAEAKINLFRSLFRGREDVFPVRWESKQGRSGYSPACRHEWNRAYCDKPKVKCGQCNNREFLPLSDNVIYDHLVGKHTIGVYPLLADDTCWFLAADFDKKSWMKDVTAYLETCKNMGIPASLERSRSGKGGHVWIFFKEPVAAGLARKLGSALLTWTMEKRYQIGLDSYDRFFPNQDTLPKGGFGNLIALPLQKHARETENSVFLDSKFLPYSDQWAFMSTISKMSPYEVEATVAKAMRRGEVVGIRMSEANGEADKDPWTLLPSRKIMDRPINEPLPKEVNTVLADLFYIEKEGLPSALKNKLIRLAAFQNPEFYKAQAMRMPVYDKPRVINCTEDFSKHIGLPRGCADEAIHLLEDLGINVSIVDERTIGKPLKVTFKGRLRDQQRLAVKELRKHDIGILSAATAFGKTVIAAKLIAVRKRNTLVLVHRRQLLDQWRAKLASFLGISESDIGQIGGGKKQANGRLDIALLQSLNRKGQVSDIVAEYGQVIVDECHHLSAFSFEQIMKRAKAKYVLGLTATPVRKDGHHPIVMMQCGPIRYRVFAKQEAAKRPFDHVMIPRSTNTTIPDEREQPSIQEIYKLLVENHERNAMIANDVLKAVHEGRSPILLTERTSHLSKLEELLAGRIRHIITLRGGMGKKQRDEIAKRLEEIKDGEERVLIAIGRYIGEGFDDPRLDTLFLTLPISWRGTLQQYAGRLHRLYEGKREVRIYDYVDKKIPMLVRMYERRLRGYKAIGYSIQSELCD
jgi:superfamily II DNA or RNA helicase